MNDAVANELIANVAAPEREIDRDAEVEGTRNRTLLSVTAEAVQDLAPLQLMEAQKILRHGDAIGTWLTPTEWLMPGTRKPAHKSINLRQRIVDHLPEGLIHSIEDPECLGTTGRITVAERVDQAVVSLTRYLLLLRLGPVGMGRKGGYRSLTPNTILPIAYTWGPALFAQAVAKSVTNAVSPLPRPPVREGAAPSEQLLGLVNAGDLAVLTKSKRKNVLQECKRMHMLAERGLWWDTPATTAISRSAAINGEAPQNHPPEKRDSHLPLPDEYVAQMGQRSLWLMRDLAPNLFVVASAISVVLEETSQRGLAQATIEEKRVDSIRTLLAAQEWRDSQGQLFTATPFPLQLPGRAGFTKAEVGPLADEFRWPPCSYRDVIFLMGAVQSAHYFIVALSMGARQSEALGLLRDCVTYAVDGRAYANGKTYKLVERHDGEWRDWFLPDAAVEALEQQVRVVSTAERLAFLNAHMGFTTLTAAPAEPSAPNHMWAQLSGASNSDATNPLTDINKALATFARTLCMDQAPGGQSLRSHRFRKTLARLVALALTQAPKLLMGVFGHKSIEMTLYYILTDKDLRAEIETVTRELRVMRAKEAVDRMVEADMSTQTTYSRSLGGYGGLGAISLHSAIGVHRDRVHRRGDQWGASNVFELAELLTLQGNSWEQVRPGVLCTKFPGEAGPCNKNKGRPEPSKCQSACGHRLEEAFLREDVDGAIRDSLKAYEIAIASNENLTAALWAAQIRAHVPRFLDLQTKWMLNATVQDLIDNRQSKVAA